MTTYSDSFIFMVSGIQQLSNSGDTISISRNLTVASGSTFTINATTFTLGTNLNFTANFSSPTITQPQNASSDGQVLTVQAQQGASGHNGGDLNLVSGTGTTNGTIHLQPGGSTAFTVATAGITVPAFGTAGIIHNSSAGLLSSSLIINADVSATANIQYSKLNLSGDIVNSDISPSANIDVSKIAPGTSAQILMSNATPTTTWTTMGGDATIGATGSVTVTQARGLLTATTTVSVSGATAPTSGQVLTATSGTAATWQTPGTGGITQLTGDVNAGAGSGSQVSYVTAISGTGGSGGSIPINATTLAFASGQSTPAVNQTAAASTSSGTGSAGQNLTVTSQAGQAATGAAHNGGNGGNLVLNTGAGGTSGSASPGTAGNVILETGGTTRLTVNQTGVITIANLGTGIVHADSSGNLTSSLIVNADVSGSAAIAYSKLTLTTSIVNGDIATAAAIAVSKLAAGTSAQILLNSATPTPTWTTLGGDASISSTGSLTVSAASGLRSATTSVSVSAATAPTSGQVLTATASNTATWQNPGAITGAVTFTTTTVNSGTTYAATTTDYYILVNTSATGSNGLMTVTLPAPAAGRTIVVKDIGGAAGTIVSGSFTNSITIAPHASEKIENLSASYVLSANFLTIRLMSDSTNWWLV